MRGIIEKWGRGTNRIIEQTLDAGLSEPEMIDSRLSFTMRFRAIASPVIALVPTGLTPIQMDVWNVLSGMDLAPLRVIRAQVDPSYSEDQIRRALQVLRQQGLAIQQRSTQASMWSLVRERLGYWFLRRFAAILSRIETDKSQGADLWTTP
ncbi:MAG: hypothetical protein M3457_16020 [Chloroflexota bacterium]|nr:hypothetical protein [Chloroflexota bacterium]